MIYQERPPPLKPHGLLVMRAAWSHMEVPKIYIFFSQDLWLLNLAGCWLWGRGSACKCFSLYWLLYCRLVYMIFYFKNWAAGRWKPVTSLYFRCPATFATFVISCLFHLLTKFLYLKKRSSINTSIIYLPCGILDRT